VGELARRVGLRPSAIRYYETEGILPAPNRSASGYRLYGPEAVVLLQFILRARELGFSVSEIRQLIEASRESPPHQVTYQKAFRFYGRDSNGKYQLDVEELRSVFAFSATAAERLKLFRIERVAKIVGGDTPVQLEVGGKIIFHMLPLASFTSADMADLNRLWRDHTLLVGVLGGGGTPLFNVDGLFLASHVRPATRYAQVFRDGCIEVVGDLSAEENQRASLLSPAFERAIIDHLYRGKQLLQHIGVAPPCAIMVTMVGMKGWRIATQSGSSSSVFDRDPVFIPELVLESFSGIVQDACKPLLDATWNAAGSPGSPNYDDKVQRKTDDT